MQATLVPRALSESRQRHGRSGSRLRARGFRSWGSGRKKESLSGGVEGPIEAPFEAPSEASQGAPVEVRDDGCGDSRVSSQHDLMVDGRKDGGGGDNGMSSSGGSALELRCFSGIGDAIGDAIGDDSPSGSPQERQKASGGSSGETSGGGVLWNPYSAEGRLEEMPRFVSECKSSGLEYEEEGEEAEEFEGESGVGGHLGVAWSCPVLLPDATLGVPPVMHSLVKRQEEEGCESQQDVYMGQPGRQQGKERGMLHEVAGARAVSFARMEPLHEGETLDGSEGEAMEGCEGEDVLGSQKGADGRASEQGERDQQKRTRAATLLVAVEPFRQRVQKAMQGQLAHGV
ncbi:unnamed protein product [Closterium sp. NIES-54]